MTTPNKSNLSSLLLVGLLATAGCSRQGASTSRPQARSAPSTNASINLTQSSRAKIASTSGLDLHAGQPFGDNPALVCSNPEVISALSSLARRAMQVEPGLFDLNATAPPDEFFIEQTHASLSNVTMNSFDPTTLLLKCDGDFTVDLSPEAAEQAANMDKLTPPTSQTQRISYQVQPLESVWKSVSRTAWL